MIVRDYSDCAASKAILVSDSFGSLMRADEANESGEVVLLVWRRGFRSVEMDAHLAQRSWPIEMLEAMPPSAQWPWKLSTAGRESTDAHAILKAVELASGNGDTPKGNVHVTLELRAYQDRGNAVGNAHWWRARAKKLRSRNAFGRSFSDMLLGALDQAMQAGSMLYTEQLSIILSKDSSAPIATLTPTLHSDSFYARRETAIVSLLEKGWGEAGGAVFLPLRNMAQLWDKRPITLDKLHRDMSDECIVVAGDGDVMIYDGMIGAGGSADPSRGIPHISPDQPGRLSRLCILMHHERPGREAGAVS